MEYIGVGGVLIRPVETVSIGRTNPNEDHSATLRLSAEKGFFLLNCLEKEVDNIWKKVRNPEVWFGRKKWKSEKEEYKYFCD